MGLYDIIDDISERNILKTDMGDNRVFGVTVGTVAKNYDKDHAGYVFVSIPTRDTSDKIFQWARLAMLSAGKSWGHYFVPEVDDQVLLAFEDGIFERPYVIACLPKDSDSYLKAGFHEQNQIKGIYTRTGNTIQFDDCDDDKGAKDKITVMTGGKEHKILLDNENSKIVISDKDGKNSVTMMTEDGKMTINAATELTIKIGDGVTMKMSDQTGSVSIQCKEFKVSASSQINMKTDGSLKLDGSQVQVAANSMVKVESSGMLKLGGTPVSVG
ncbi:MAG: phage baseplate assembly protein V [Eubacteriales bacterium]